MKKGEMTVGFAIAPTMNTDAIQNFATQEVIGVTHAVKSSDEIHRYVDSMVNKQ